MPTLGGTLITRDCIRLDYCFESAIRSLLPVVDEMVVVDCGSTDGTLERLEEIEAEPDVKLRVFSREDWDCAPDYHRLSIMANHARSYLLTDWHFMIQADEVLHESSYGPIRDAIRERKRPVFVRRLNLFGGIDRMLRLDLPPGSHPCGHTICRLAPAEHPAYADAENLAHGPYGDRSMVDLITLFHYGYVRRDAEHLAKTLEMQSWFHGPGSQPDSRVVEMQADGRYAWERMKPAEWLCELPMGHPAAAMPWVERRRAEG